MGSLQNRFFSGLVPLALFSFALLHLQTPSAALASMPAKFAIAPESAGVLLQDVLLEAKSELLINVYKFESPEIADLLASRIRDGLRVQVLIEGQPVAGLTQEGRAVLKQLQTAMQRAGNASNRLLVMRRLTQQKRRFRWNHAKYVVVDRKRIFVTSENFNVTGLPLQPAPGVRGNRGWATSVEDRDLAAELADVFAEDAETSFSDVEVLYPSRRAASSRADRRDSKEARPCPAVEVLEGRMESAELITSPQALDALKKALARADRRVDLQYMSITPTWRDQDYQKVVNPYLSELIRTAKRGVHLRVLLNDERTFLPKDKIPPGFRGSNDDSAEILRKAAYCQKLPLEVKIIDPQGVNITYIHNKGILVDQDEVLVSSINGTQTSMTKNREVAVFFESREANDYYSRTFETDWSISPSLPPWSDEELRRLRMQCPRVGTTPMAGEFGPVSLLRYLMN